MEVTPMPDATMESLLRWSQEFDFSADSIHKNAPQTAGVYEILQSPEYSRYSGTTRVLKIGMSESSVRAELLNHLGRHTAANRLTRIRLQRDISVSFKYITLE